MIFDLLAPPQGPRPKKCAVACPIHVSNSHTKFGWVSSNGLRGDSVTEGQMDRGMLLQMDSCWVLSMLEKVAKKS